MTPMASELGLELPFLLSPVRPSSLSFPSLPSDLELELEFNFPPSFSDLDLELELEPLFLSSSSPRSRSRIGTGIGPFLPSLFRHPLSWISIWNWNPSSFLDIHHSLSKRQFSTPVHSFMKFSKCRLKFVVVSTFSSVQDYNMFICERLCYILVANVAGVALSQTYRGWWASVFGPTLLP